MPAQLVWLLSRLVHMQPGQRGAAGFWVTLFLQMRTTSLSPPSGPGHLEIVVVFPALRPLALELTSALGVGLARPAQTVFALKRNIAAGPGGCTVVAGGGARGGQMHANCRAPYFKFAALKGRGRAGPGGSRGWRCDWDESLMSQCWPPPIMRPAQSAALQPNDSPRTRLQKRYVGPTVSQSVSRSLASHPPRRDWKGRGGEGGVSQQRAASSRKEGGEQEFYDLL